MYSRLCLAALLSLAACGDLPQPFLGHPGAAAERLAQPPPSRLAVLSPTESLLPAAAAEACAAAVADALRTEEVPATADAQQAVLAASHAEQIGVAVHFRFWHRK